MYFLLRPVWRWMTMRRHKITLHLLRRKSHSTLTSTPCWESLLCKFFYLIVLASFPTCVNLKAKQIYWSFTAATRTIGQRERRCAPGCSRVLKEWKSEACSVHGGVFTIFQTLQIDHKWAVNPTNCNFGLSGQHCLKCCHTFNCL